MRWTSRQTAGLVSLAVTLSGCGSPPLFQVETAIRPDGTCERTVWQPEGEMLPPEAANAEWRARWSRIAPIASPPAFDNEEGRDRDRKYFTASGTFPSPADIPEHFRNDVAMATEHAVGRLEHRYDRIDFTFVVEHRWCETLSNIVTREGFLGARADLLDAALPMLCDGIRSVYGTSYEVRGLVRYLREDGRRFLERASVIWFEHSAAHGPDEELATRLAELARGYGLDLLDGAGKLVEGEEREARIERFLRHRVVLGLRHRDGSRLSEAEVRAVTDLRAETPYSRSWSQYWEGRRREIEARLSGPLMRMVGIYNHPLGLSGAGNPRFAFSLRLPGEIVASSGSIHGGSEARWRFRGDRSFPDGFTMEARSLEIDREAQRKILGRVAIDNVDQALALVREVEPSANLRNLFKTLRESGSLQPLEAAQPVDETDRERLSRIRRLLGRPG